MSAPVPLSKKDFTSDQEVRWCPGCGDYAILNAVQKTMPELGIPRENVVFISGIGCAARFPYYMNTYGFHTIHGRAPAIATGLRITRPELSVWVVSGDGDALSIGGNHLIHALRRNVNIKILLFNNEIYGLTKGQYSPTSREGTIAKSTPYGSVDHPFTPLALAMGAEASFTARIYDKDIKMMSEVIRAAHEHKGGALIEILQNCVIFNDKVFDPIVGRDVIADQTVHLQDGRPLIFGRDENRAIRMNGFVPEAVELGSVPEKELLVHDSRIVDPTYSYMLARMQGPQLPLALGILRRVERPVYEEQMQQQSERVTQQRGKGDLARLLQSGDTWRIG